MPDDPFKKATGDTVPAAAKAWPDVERRLVPRYPFSASAEVTEEGTEVRLSARISELSLRGCYLDLLNPFAEGTVVRLRVLTDKGSFQAWGRVLYVHAGFGMGVVFSEITPDMRSVLQKWLAELSSS